VLTVAEVSALLAGCGVLLVAFAMSRAASQAALDGRLRTFVRREMPRAPVSVLRAREERQPEIVERMNRRLRRASLARRLQDDLTRAGIDMPSSRFLMLQGCGAAGAIWLTTLTLTNRLGDATVALALGGVAGAAAWFAPRVVLMILEGRRLKRFEQQLPTAIDSLAGALQAGSGLLQAMEMVGREMPAPIGQEMATVVREMSVGVPMTQAFANMLTRVRSLDLDMLVTAISIQHRVGGNLSQILRSISHTIRERLRIKGEIAVLTAQQRLGAIIVSGLPLVIIAALFFLSPDYIMKLFQPGIARVLLVIGGIGIAAGFYCLRRIADIDV
jgi:tight adherence protein B